MSKTWICLLALLGAACGSEPATLSEVETEVFQNSCTFSACHDTATAQAGLSLASPTFQALVNAASTQVPSKMRVVPGNPSASYLMEKITGTATVGELMPPAQMLSQERIDLIEDWIEAGANDD